MKDFNLSKQGKTELSIIENHLLELYYSGVETENKRIMSELRLIVKEKETRSDHTAADIILWAIDRLNKDI